MPRVFLFFNLIDFKIPVVIHGVFLCLYLLNLFFNLENVFVSVHILSRVIHHILLGLDSKFTSSNFIILKLNSSSLKFWIALDVCLLIAIYLCGIMLTILRFNNIKYGW